MMAVRNEIKAQIVRADTPCRSVVDRLHEGIRLSDSVFNLSAKLQRESIRYKGKLWSWPMCWAMT